jgi:hypothetical protein
LVTTHALSFLPYPRMGRFIPAPGALTFVFIDEIRVRVLGLSQILDFCLQVERRAPTGIIVILYPGTPSSRE